MKHLTNLYITFIGLCVFTVSCSPKLGTSWKEPNYQGKSYQKVVVVGIGGDLTGQRLFENNAVQLLRNNGVYAVSGTTIFPPNLSPKEDDDSEIIEILKKNKIDGVITMSLINENQSQRYVQGQTRAIPTGYVRFGKYYYRTYTHVREPGYYINQNSYLIEAVLYDVSGELKEGDNTMVWTGQSSLINPSSAKGAAVTFTERMVGTLLAEGLLKEPSKE